MEQKSTVLTLGSVLTCRGSIEAGPDQQEHLEEFIERLARGEFFDAVTSGVAIPVRCVDGRSPEAAKPLAPNSAGGTESLFVADDLTTKRFAGEDGMTVSGYRNVVTFLQDSGYEVGGHTSTHAHGRKSGCGANDEYEEIARYIAGHAEELRVVSEAIGMPISHEIMDLIVSNARARSSDSFSDGSELLDALKEKAGDDYLDVLEGDHKEVAAVINMREGTTLNRTAIRQDELFGDDYQAFNVDAWAFKKAAETISVTPEEVEQKVAAMVLYNLATTAVLAGGNLRVIVLEAEQIAA